ncbi:MAG TPA: hypothetical protein VK427_22380, partial [Kofleriaceae bacterium]|nr:hypothetical protein [Kofleriaceae bacterium]
MKEIWLEGPQHAKQVMRARMGPMLFQDIGLPPGTDVDWLFDGGVGYEVFRVEKLGAIVPDDKLAPGYVKRMIPQELEERSERRLYQKAGVKPPGVSFIADRWAVVNKRNEALVLRVPRANMEAMLGKDRWAEISEGKKGRNEAATAMSPFGGLDFATGMSIEDREYFLDWAKRVYGSVPDGMGTPADPTIVLTLQRIDAHPLKDKLLTHLKKSAPDGRKVDWQSLDRLIHDFEQAEVATKYGVAGAGSVAGKDDKVAEPRATPTTSDTGPRARYYERPITGEVVSLGSLASVGKEMELYFSTTDRQGIGFVSVNVHWIATEIGNPGTRVREGYTHHLAHHSPDKWVVTFDKVGTYRITAFVDHDSYWPRAFDDTIVEVKTGEERLDQVESAAFADLGKTTNRDAAKQEFFEVSWTNDRLGDDKYTFGDLTEGEVPADFQHRSLEERVKFFADDRAKLVKLIETYEKGSGKYTRGAKDVVGYARHALETLDSTKARIDSDGKDLMPFEIRGAFLSEKNGVKSGTMNLIGLAGKRTQTINAGAVSIQKPEVSTVRIHDLSQLYEPKNAVYTGQSHNFREAIEDAFVDLCKSYPPGRVSILFEQLGDDYKPNGKTMGFELHTGTAWKDAKSTVWDGKVQLGVNIVAAAASVFIPGAALVAMPLITAYNAVDTLD